NSHVTVLDVNGYVKTNFVLKSAFDSLEQKYPKNISLVTDKIIKKEFLAKQDLMIISIESWKLLVDSRSIWLSRVPSILIIKH
ncbi:MAG: cation/H(+) antiporter, partial [Flavobacterium sp.]|nr:cation/H(+) antiporter [Flavobacterium sp.]